MALLRNLVQGFHRLAVGNLSTSASLVSSHTILSRNEIHSSAVCFRDLDNRLTRTNKERSRRSNRWVLAPDYKKMEYTTKPMLMPRLGGRGPNGRIWNHRRRGGERKYFRMIDWVRPGDSENKDRIERVKEIMPCKNRSGHIALVAAENQKRFILATANMKPGDLITSSNKLTKSAVRAKEGDSYPVGSLPVGSLVNCLEKFPGCGGYFARAAGVSAQLVRKSGDTCVLQLPSKREVQVSSKCSATLGRISNVDHNKRVIGSAGNKRRLGYAPRSGRWHRKTGRFGRKIKSPGAMKVYNKAPASDLYLKI